MPPVAKESVPCPTVTIIEKVVYCLLFPLLLCFEPRYGRFIIHPFIQIDEPEEGVIYTCSAKNAAAYAKRNQT